MEYFLQSFVAASIGVAIALVIRWTKAREERSTAATAPGAGAVAAVGHRYAPMQPPPEYVNAWLSLNTHLELDIARAPEWAALWMADGHDGQHLRQLAGLSDTDPSGIETMTRCALDEMGHTAVSPEEAGRIVFDTWAQACLAGDLDEFRLALDVHRLFLACGYGDWLSKQPLGQTFGIDDERIGGHGRTEIELRAAVIDACQRQLDSSTS